MGVGVGFQTQGVGTGLQVRETRVKTLDLGVGTKMTGITAKVTCYVRDVENPLPTHFPP